MSVMSEMTKIWKNLKKKIFKKKLKIQILSKNYYNWRHKNIDHHPINSRNYAAAGEVPVPLVPAEIQKKIKIF